jgi:HPt (histidine-containing phosphotransfer) domain-containing protein
MTTQPQNLHQGRAVETRRRFFGISLGVLGLASSESSCCRWNVPLPPSASVTFCFPSWFVAGKPRRASANKLERPFPAADRERGSAGKERGFTRDGNPETGRRIGQRRGVLGTSEPGSRWRPRVESSRCNAAGLLFLVFIAALCPACEPTGRCALKLAAPKRCGEHAAGEGRTPAGDPGPLEQEPDVGKPRGDEKLLQEVIEIFLEEAPKHLAALHLAVAQGDAKAIEAIAHGLTGELGYLNVPEAHRMAGELESLGRRSDLEGPATLLRRLEFDVSGLLHSVRNARSVAL